MFTQTRCDQGKHKYTSGNNLSQVDTVPGKDGNLYSNTECYTCRSYGHFFDQYPDKETKAIHIAMIGVILMQNGNAINKTWILLDTCSTDSVTNNLDYVEDVKNFAK